MRKPELFIYPYSYLFKIIIFGYNLKQWESGCFFVYLLHHHRVLDLVRDLPHIGKCAN